MKTMFKKNGKRVLSAALCLLMAVMSLPLSAFAWTSEEGRSCTSSFGDYYVGLDGEYYRSQATMHTLVYNDDGSTYVKSYSSGNAKTFTTDRNGEIFVEGLRIGDYTVSEVNDKASAGYILPADKQLTIKVGATTIVQMHNEFRDTPKTGDDFNLGLWVSLAAVSLAGAGVLGFIGFKNRKKKED